MVSMRRLFSILLAGLVVWAGVAAAGPPLSAANARVERVCGCPGCDPAHCCCLESAPAEVPHPLEALPAGSPSVFHPSEFLSASGSVLSLPKRREAWLPAPDSFLPLPGPVALFKRDCAWLI